MKSRNLERKIRQWLEAMVQHHHVTFVENTTRKRSVTWQKFMGLSVFLAMNVTSILEIPSILSLTNGKLMANPNWTVPGVKRVSLALKNCLSNIW